MKSLVILSSNEKETACLCVKNLSVSCCFMENDADRDTVDIVAVNGGPFQHLL